jgi:hypothetical protein
MYGYKLNLSFFLSFFLLTAEIKQEIKQLNLFDQHS